MNWYIVASKVKPVSAIDTNYSNFLNNSFNNGSGTKKKSDPKNNKERRKDKGLGGKIDVDA